MARALREAGIVENISSQSVQRILESQKLKPWRVHHWLSSKVPRAEAFYAQVMVIRDLYTRVLEPHECVLSLDEKTSIQPRTRTTATKPARPNKVPVRLEHEYLRKGAFNLFAAFISTPAQVKSPVFYDAENANSNFSRFSKKSTPRHPRTSRRFISSATTSASTKGRSLAPGLLLTRDSPCTSRGCIARG